ncbi:MAG: ATP-binding protein [Oleiphilaceae bacterium]|nr:ATP-binding protein [Oleiphilaceae bacterium]
MKIDVSKRLSVRLTRNTVISALALGMVLNMGLVTQDYFNAKRDMDNDINALIEISHSPASQIAYNIDTRLAEELLAGLLQHQAIIEASIIDPDGQALAHRRDAPLEAPYRWLSDLLFESRLSYQSELKVSQLDSVELGTLNLVVDTNHYSTAFLERAGYTLISGFIKSLALAILLLFIFYFMLTKPLLRVISGLAGVEGHEAEKARLPTPLGHQSDEIGLLVRITNKHLDAIDHSLQQQRQAEGRLKEYNEKLTQIVEMRTREIQDKNRALQTSNRALRHAKEEALDRARSRADFLASMSHEIRTPLNGLLGMLSLALDSDIGPGERNRLEIARNAGYSLLSLVNDILDISKVEAGKLSLESIPFDLGGIAEECALLFAEPGQRNHVPVILQLDPNLPGQFRGDPTRTRQIINNLLGNAIKFTSQGHVQLRVSQEGHVTRIQVSDTGIGMSEATQEAIFAPFSQGHSDTTRRFGGTGLGLTLCQQLVEHMQGEIHVESEENRGSTFMVDLPLPIVTRDNLPAGVSELSGTRVLLMMDPDHLHGSPLQQTLEHWGLITRFVGHGAPPGETHWDLVITDRPRQSGLPKGVPVMTLGTPSDAAEADLPHRVIELPLVRKQLLNALRINLELVPEPPQAKVEDEVNDTPLRVLLVEDNRVNQLVASGMLRKLGHSVDLAENGERALLALENQHYDLVLMDCQMPVMDGYQATRMIRGNPRLKHLPVIAITANVMQGDREACLDAGMDDYITKPYTLESLRDTLRRWSPTKT